MEPKRRGQVVITRFGAVSTRLGQDAEQVEKSIDVALREGTSAAQRQSGFNRMTIYNWLKQLGLSPGESSSEPVGYYRLIEMPVSDRMMMDYAGGPRRRA